MAPFHRMTYGTHLNFRETTRMLIGQGRPPGKDEKRSLRRGGWPYWESALMSLSPSCQLMGDWDQEEIRERRLTFKQPRTRQGQGLIWIWSRFWRGKTGTRRADEKGKGRWEGCKKGRGRLPGFAGNICWGWRGNRGLVQSTRGLLLNITPIIAASEAVIQEINVTIKMSSI